jgi:hypothetical protein
MQSESIARRFWQSYQIPRKQLICFVGDSTPRTLSPFLINFNADELPP